MNKGSGFALVPVFVIVFLACATQAAAPVSPPESRFVWEPGENLTFTWTHDNFDGFYYDPDNDEGTESLSIKNDNITDRSIKENNWIYSTTVVNVPFKYRPFGNYSMIGFLGERYFAGYTSGSRIARFPVTLVNRSLFGKILVDDNKVHTLTNESNLTLNEKYVLKIRVLNITEGTVLVILDKFGGEIDHRVIKAGDTYVFEKDGREVISGSSYIYTEPITIGKLPIIAVHVDSVFGDKNGETGVVIKGIFQLSDVYTSVDPGYGMMRLTKISDTGITINLLPVDLKRGSIIDIIGNIKLKVADSNTLRLHLYSDRYENHDHRGATGSNNITAWDGLNYAGFLYDADSGNYSESLVITNVTGRRIPEGGLTYTSYIRRVNYSVTKVTGEKIPGTGDSYIRFRLGGKKYTERNNGFAELLIAQGELMAHGDSSFEKKLLAVGPNEFLDDIWELGEGYTLMAPSIDYSKEPRKARLVLKRNGVEIEDIWFPCENVYVYALPGETENLKLITYIDACFAGSMFDVIQFRYTWFVSDNVTQIKEGGKLGVFNVTVMEPDRIVLTNREPIELKAGSSIYLLGNLSFYVQNSDELRFYPINMGGTQMMEEEVTVNEAQDIPDMTIPVGTSPVAGRTERAAGFEIIISLAAFIAIYQIIGRKNG